MTALPQRSSSRVVSGNACRFKRSMQYHWYKAAFKGAFMKPGKRFGLPRSRRSTCGVVGRRGRCCMRSVVPLAMNTSLFVVWCRVPGGLLRPSGGVRSSRAGFRFVDPCNRQMFRASGIDREPGGRTSCQPSCVSSQSHRSRAQSPSACYSRSPAAFR